jgi:hypothetical protein
MPTVFPPGLTVCAQTTAEMARAVEATTPARRRLTFNSFPHQSGAVVTHSAASNRQCDWSTFMADEYLLPLNADEKLALVALLKRTIDDDRYPLSPRICTLRGHAKFDAMPCRCRGVVGDHLPLHLERTAYRVDDAGKLGEQSVAGVF